MVPRDNLGYRGFEHIVVTECRFASPCDLAKELTRDGANVFILGDFLFGP